MFLPGFQAVLRPANDVTIYAVLPETERSTPVNEAQTLMVFVVVVVVRVSLPTTA